MLQALQHSKNELYVQINLDPHRSSSVKTTLVYGKVLLRSAAWYLHAQHENSGFTKVFLRIKNITYHIQSHLTGIQVLQLSMSCNVSV